MRLERLLRASGFEPTARLRRLVKANITGNSRLYRWVLVGPSLFLRWSLDMNEPAFLMDVEHDQDSYDGLSVVMSVRDPRTFMEINMAGYNSSGDLF